MSLGNIVLVDGCSHCKKVSFLHQDETSSSELILSVPCLLHVASFEESDSTLFVDAL